MTKYRPFVALKQIKMIARGKTNVFFLEATNIASDTCEDENVGWIVVTCIKGNIFLRDQQSADGSSEQVSSYRSLHRSHGGNFHIYGNTLDYGGIIKSAG